MRAKSTDPVGMATNTFTPDCSVAVSWLIQEQSNAAIDTLFQDGYRSALTLVVPILWFTECGNVLNEMVKRHRLTLAQAQEGLRVLRFSRVQADEVPTVDMQTRTLALAHTHELSFYDACYLELAQRRRCLLATLDQKLRAAAHAAGVNCLSL